MYETPGGTILYKAHSVLETLCLDKMTMHEKQKLAVTFGELVYNGKWYTPLQRGAQRVRDQDAGARHRHGAAQALQGQHDQRRRYLAVLPVLRESRHLRRERLNQAEAEGFIQLYGLPISVQAKVDGKSM